MNPTKVTFDLRQCDSLKELIHLFRIYKYFLYSQFLMNIRKFVAKLNYHELAKRFFSNRKPVDLMRIARVGKNNIVPAPGCRSPHAEVGRGGDYLSGHIQWIRKIRPGAAGFTQRRGPTICA